VAVIERATDPRYLAYQYDDSEKLRIRIEAHALYSEHSQDDWYPKHVAQLGPAAGESVLDVGCGFGAFHRALTATGADVLAFDYSGGMVREARGRAKADGLSVRLFRADAQAIPLPDHSVDHALSSHMLYHVPDIEQALKEMRRVVKVGGRVLITTNAADNLALFYELHARASGERGFTVTNNSPNRRFNLGHLPLVQSVFPQVTAYRQSNAFLFPTVESALRYYASGQIDAIADRDEGGAHREVLLERMAELIAEIIAREGVFRVPKDAGSFLATVEP
jgi:ubiquinone/menaquinone biosynthesis C-methylase UbiE